MYLYQVVGCADARGMGSRLTWLLGAATGAVASPAGSRYYPTENNRYGGVSPAVTRPFERARSRRGNHIQSFVLNDMDRRKHHHQMMEQGLVTGVAGHQGQNCIGPAFTDVKDGAEQQGPDDHVFPHVQIRMFVNCRKAWPS